jgi:hypothetical protein
MRDDFAVFWRQSAQAWFSDLLSLLLRLYSLLPVPVHRPVSHLISVRRAGNSNILGLELMNEYAAHTNFPRLNQHKSHRNAYLLLGHLPGTCTSTQSCFCRVGTARLII